MTDEKQRKPLGTDVDTRAVDDFSAWTKQNKLVKAQAAATAMRLLRILPIKLRNAAMNDEWKKLEDWLARALELMEDHYGTPPNDAIVDVPPPISEEKRMRRLSHVPPPVKPPPQTPKAAAELPPGNENVNPIRRAVKDATIRETTKESQPAKGQKSA